MSAIALPATAADLLAEYEAKQEAVEVSIAAMQEAVTAFRMACAVQGTFVDRIIDARVPCERDVRQSLLKSGWKAIYNRLGIADLASAKDKALFERTLADPPPLTFENCKATFGDYFARPRWHILRGLAEVFVGLDPAYKSHSKVKIGVAGLPKRIILPGWGEYSYGYARDRFRDMVNALATYQGKPHYHWDEGSAIDIAHRSGEDAVLDGRSYSRSDRNGKVETFATVNRGLTVRRFGNGNAHIIFAPETLLDINRALAEFYGDVLPDAEEEDAEKRPGTAVARDLQFYWSPPAVIEAALSFAGIEHPNQYRNREAPPRRVLEPSCGDGRILDELRARGCRAIGFEVDPGRAAECRAKGHAVICANFLDQPPTPDFDYVVMNPPFYGRHYAKHVRHALKFLRPGGVLVSILPATAHYDHDEIKGEWRDLPVASFAAAGTNVPTGLMRIVRKADSGQMELATMTP